MYIPEFWAGVICTILAEFVGLFVAFGISQRGKK